MLSADVASVTVFLPWRSPRLVLAEEECDYLVASVDDNDPDVPSQVVGQ